jgi:hypothetical protein
MRYRLNENTKILTEQFAIRSDAPSPKGKRYANVANAAKRAIRNCERNW